MFTYCDKRVPTLGLVEDVSFPYRVYVLELADNCVYVGIAHKSDIKRAVERHFNTGGGKAHFTMVHPPKKVLLIWPAVSMAVEAYLLPHLGWIAARAPNRVNRAHGPTKENRQNLGNFGFFRPTQKMGWEGPKWGGDVFFSG